MRSPDESSMIKAILVVLGTSILYFIYWCIQHKRKFQCLDHLPGPKPLPVLGNILEFGQNCVAKLFNIHRLMIEYGPACKGHDTTASGISFALYEISRNQNVQNKIVEELKDILGQKFAMYEMKAALCKILRHFELEPDNDQKQLILSAELILKAENGISLKIKNRQL
ncbi:Cytochrome P450 4d2 [Carabus blaptoides fortunei]